MTYNSVLMRIVSGARLLSAASRGSATVLTEFLSDSRVAHLKLNRPTCLNASNTLMVQELAQSLRQIEDSEVKCVVVSGVGGCFSSGRDLKMSMSLNRDAEREYLNHSLNAILAVVRCKVPVVAAIERFAIGWGFELALACDLRVSSRDAFFRFPECQLGIFPGAGGPLVSPHVLGMSTALDLMLTGRKMTADEAERKGVIARLAGPGCALTIATEVAKGIATGNTASISHCRYFLKKNLSAHIESPGLLQRYFEARYDVSDKDTNQEYLSQLQAYVSRKE